MRWLGVTHIEEGASDQPLKAVFVEFKEPDAPGAMDAPSTPRVVPGRRRHGSPG